METIVFYVKIKGALQFYNYVTSILLKTKIHISFTNTSLCMVIKIVSEMVCTENANMGIISYLLISGNSEQHSI